MVFECEALPFNKTYYCENCSIEYFSYVKYFQHRLAHLKTSINANKPPYTKNLGLCPLCNTDKTMEKESSESDHVLFSDDSSSSLTSDQIKWDELSKENLKHKCEICLELFSDLPAYKVHLKGHTGACLTCPHCPNKFTRQNRMDEHIQRVHLKFSQGYACDQCDKVYSWKQSLFAHKKLHETDCPSCPQCDLKFISNAKVQAHIKQTHDREGPIFRCEVCQKEFAKERNLITHKRIHTDKSLSCLLCDQKFSRRSALNDHIEIIHVNKGKGFMCGLCPKMFSGRQSLNLHRKLHTNKCSVCTYCGSKFPTAQKLHDHVERLHKKQSVNGLEEQKKQCFVCTYCSKKYIRLSKLKEHIEKDHVNHTANPCDICEKTFANETDLKQHKDIHEEECSVCPYCEEKFYFPAKIDEHLIVAHPDEEKKYKCHVCPKVLNTIQNLKLHKRLHNDRCSVCPHCNQKFVRPSLLKAHIKTSHVEADGPLTCPDCLQVFKRPHLLELHSRIHTEQCFSCDQCDKRFPRRFKLLKHIAMVHDEQKTFICDQCPKVFARQTTLKSHRKIHTDDCLKCPHCDKKFVRPYVLREHIERSHVNQKQGLKCDHCPKIFSRKDTLRMHLRIHTGNCFKCSDCEQQFIRMSDLNEHHERIHVNLNQGYKCEVCEKVFRRKDSLKLHSRIHNNQFLICPHCEKKFIRCAELNVHVEKVHNDKETGTFECEVCSMVFLKRSKYLVHIQKYNREHGSDGFLSMGDELSSREFGQMDEMAALGNFDMSQVEQRDSILTN